MLQAVMTRPGAIEFRDVPVPECRPGEVLIEVRRIGVCGSDIHVYHGRHPYTSYPVVQGHEVSGIVRETGAGVSGFRTGDKATIRPQISCGACYPCRHGDYHICDDLKVMGFQAPGAAAEYVAVDAAKLVKLPEGMSLDAGAMIEPLAVAVHALGRAGGAAGKKVAVIGAGPIGNLVAQAAKGLGAAETLIADISSFRLGLAAACGADRTVDVGREDLGAALDERFGPDKADLILECVGAQATIAQAVGLARKGTDIVVVGVFGEKPTVDLGLVQDRELRLIGTLMYREEDYREAIRLVEEGLVKLGPLVTDHFAFRDYLRAYEHIEARKDRAMKVMIDVGEGGRE